MITVISHTHNEASLMLPFWIKHHLPMFDHGVIIDYTSTDSTVSICKDLAPTWEVRQSRNRDFASQPVDDEVMDIERTIDGWKIALTTTEFLCGDITAVIQSLAFQGDAAAQVRPIAMVDPDLRNAPLDVDAPLVDQCHHGFATASHSNAQPRSVAHPHGLSYRSRLLHSHPDGAYTLGRHGTNHLDVYPHYPDDLVILWFAYAPMTPEFIARKVGTYAQIPASEAWRGFNPSFVYDEAQVISDWQNELPSVIDLRTVPEYVAVVG